MDVYTIIPVGLHVLSSVTFHLLLTMHAQRWATFAHVDSSADFWYWWRHTRK